MLDDAGTAWTTVDIGPVRWPDEQVSALCTVFTWHFLHPEAASAPLAGPKGVMPRAESLSLAPKMKGTKITSLWTHPDSSCILVVLAQPGHPRASFCALGCFRGRRGIGNL